MNRIKQLRDVAEVKQVDLANMLGISQGTLSNWERGIHDPDSESLIAIAKYFNVTTDFVLGKDDTASLSPDEDIRFALNNLPHDLTEEERQKVIEYAEFLKQQRKNRS